MLPVHQQQLWQLTWHAALNTPHLESQELGGGEIFRSIVTQTPNQQPQKAAISLLPRVCETQNSSFQIIVPKLKQVQGVNCKIRCGYSSTKGSPWWAWEDKPRCVPRTPLSAAMRNLISKVQDRAGLGSPESREFPEHREEPTGHRGKWSNILKQNPTTS